MNASFDNIDLYYEWIHPERKGPVVLFLHEGLGSVSLWKDFPQKLCDLLELSGLIYDRQGHGKSSPLMEERDENYLEKYALEELPAFLNAIELDRPLILFGHSDGGSIALIYAARFPEKVQAVITEAAHIYVEEKTWKGIEPVIQAFEKRAGFYKALYEHHGEKAEATFYAWAKTWEKKKEHQWSIAHYLNEVQADVLAIQGKEDEYASDRHLLLIQQHLRKNSIALFVSDCQHHPHQEQENTVLKSVEAFIKLLE